MDNYPNTGSTEPTEPTEAVRAALERVKAATTGFVADYAKQPESDEAFEDSDVFKQRTEYDAQYERLGLETLGYMEENDQAGALLRATLAYVLDMHTKRFDRPNNGEGSVVTTVIPLPGSKIEQRVADILKLGTDSERPTISVVFTPNAGRIEINGINYDRTQRVFIGIETDDPDVPEEVIGLLGDLSEECVQQFKNPPAVHETKRFMN